MTGLNTAFETELYYEYLKNPDSVSPEWRVHFEKLHGKSVSALDEQGRQIEPKEPKEHHAEPTKLSKEMKKSEKDGKSDGVQVKEGETLEELPHISARLAENMEASLSVPTATSTRTMPVKALDENRRIINKHLVKLKKRKVSFTHILLWAIVRALKRYPHMNDAYTVKDGKPYRIKRKSVNVGLAVDITKKDGSRLLLVPNVKNAQDLEFSEFMEAFNEIIEKSRNNKLTLDDLMNTTVTLTNPGMIGTTASSPRLMTGQGMIIASGSIDYPTEFSAVRPDVLTTMAISKVVTITNTYDHRIIQGAESAEFLDYINRLLIGEKHFYDQIFVSLNIPFEPVRWALDKQNGYDRNIFDQDDMIEKSAHVMQLINAYRVRGHLLSSINPLGNISYYYPELDPAYYGFTIWDLDRIFHTDDAWENNNMPLRDIIEILRETYCGHIGVEFMHIQAPNKKEWIKRTLESTRNSKNYTKNDKLSIFKKLVEAEIFENFLHTKYVGHKRFSLEGNETLINFLEKILEQAALKELHTVVLGMPHRGRLNVLVNNIRKDPGKIFAEFDDEIDPQRYHGSGDVKYHLGDKGNYTVKDKSVNVILSSNPSHLELVNPVIEGMTRAIDNLLNDRNHAKGLPVLIHGDAAFSGQGIVAETLNLSQLQGFKVGGTIHIVVNNQIGFTTNETEARSTVYATDIAKLVQIPIIHVNGNDPEAVQTAAAFAFDYRLRFNSDVIIDLLGYRKYGHNEADEPSYTQPLLYKKIKSMPSVRKVYQNELIKEGILTNEEAERYAKDYKKQLEKLYQERKNKHPENIIEPVNYKRGDVFKDIDTSVEFEKLRKIGKSITTIPGNFNANTKVSSQFKKRNKLFDQENPKLDWSYAEALAFGSILTDGREIRFSGEDSRRGTFSQRHAVLTDVKTEDEYVPLNHIEDGQATLRIYDSPLSELAVLGFEYGYSVMAKDHLTLWEAQFGDFVNMAQPIIDQFIACAEVKWGQTSNLAMLLPHSYDGQGPEHSSARLERMLQLSAEENMIVCNLTTPAQYFHVLRRQVIAPFNKPLVIMTPKGMLRHPRSVSGIEEFTDGGFQPAIDDPTAEPPEKISRVLMCSGKLYYELLEKREEENRGDVAIVRIEQLYPFDADKIGSILKRYNKTKEFVWVQEEPKNNGAWHYINPLLRDVLLKKQELRYAGRKRSAATATGSYRIHVQEQTELINNAFGEFEKLGD